MSKTPNYDAKVKAILDATEPGERVCELTGEKWMMDEEEINWLKHFQVPPSELSPLSRMRSMTATFTGGQWWYNKHAVTGKSIISSVHPWYGVKVLTDQEWYAEDFSKHGREYDPSRSFFDQLWDLRLAVPESANRNYEKTENSISTASYGDVNSYFMVASRSKNCFYSVVAMDAESSAEVYNGVNVTDSYLVVLSNRIHKSQYIYSSRDVLGSAFLFDCRNCECCFGATNKRNQKYLWFNEQLSKEEWEKRRSEVDLGSRKQVETYKHQFNKLMESAVWPESFNEKSPDCIGEYMTECTDCRWVYFANGGAVRQYWTCWPMGQAESCAYSSNPSNSSNVWYCAAADKCSNNKYNQWNTRSSNIEYSTMCYDCEDCFGCVGLQKKRFHILNKAYSEEEYWKLLDKIKCKMLEDGEYGRFLPGKFSMGYFPDTGAVKYHLAEPDFGQKLGVPVFNPSEAGAMGEHPERGEAPASVDLPDSIDACEEWVGKAVWCEKAE